MNIIRILILASASLAGCAPPEEMATQAPSAPHRTDLLTATLPAGVSVSKVEIRDVSLTPWFRAPRHVHPCPVVGVVTEGAISFQIEGQPVQHLHAGDAFYEPPNERVAKFDNDGSGAAKFTAFYLMSSGEQELVRPEQ